MKLIKKFFDFFKTKEFEYYSVISVEPYKLGDATGIRAEFKLIKEIVFMGTTCTQQEIVQYDNLHRRPYDNVFWTFCPYVHDKKYMSEQTTNHDGWGFLVNTDSTNHSFVKLTKKEIEDAIDAYWHKKGIIVKGNWN